MATVDLKAEVRTAVGKAEAKRLRRARRLPGIVYGGPQGPLPVVVNPQELLGALAAGENILINLALGGGQGDSARTVILKELQLDPVKGRPLHADFLEVSMERKVRVEVPVVLAGESVGVKGKGGILEDGGRVVASVVAPAAEEVAAPVEEKPAEPEVVGKKEKEKAEAEAEPEAKPKAEGKTK